MTNGSASAAIGCSTTGTNLNKMEIANLPDREERIAARRRRAETKLRREKEEQEAHPDDLLEEQPQGLGKQRVSLDAFPEP